MAQLLSGTTAAGATAWHQGNYPIQTFTWNASGNYTANTGFTLFNWNDLGINGFCFITGFADTNAVGGAAWSSQFTVPGIFPIKTNGTNTTSIVDYGSAVYAGHAPNGEGWSFRVVYNLGSAGARLNFQALTTRNVSGIDGTGRRSFSVKIRQFKSGF
jgi:hypothetical protein